MKYLLLILVLILSGCSSTSTVFSNSETASIMNLIALTEEQAPNGVEGTFQLPIKASGSRRGIVYLNTEKDYRDRRNITVVIPPNLIKSISNKYGESPETFFINKTIEITGEAKQVKIFFISRGKITDKYYFQTHIKLESLTQIRVLN